MSLLESRRAAEPRGWSRELVGCAIRYRSAVFTHDISFFDLCGYLISLLPVSIIISESIRGYLSSHMALSQLRSRLQSLDLGSRTRSLGLPPRTLEAAALLLSLPPLTYLLFKARKSYNAFLDLGPGGVPYNVVGWVVATFVFGPLTLGREKACDNSAFDKIIAREKDHGEREKGNALSLPQRSGSRPLCSTSVPHRQLEDQASGETKQRLDVITHQLLDQYQVEWKPSGHEKHVSAPYVLPSVVQAKQGKLPEAVRLGKGEIGHVHGDGSGHWYFSAQDAKEVVSKGWGERHQFAGDGALARWIGLTGTFVLVYAPRDEEEIEIFKTLVERSTRWMTGEL